MTQSTPPLGVAANIVVEAGGEIALCIAALTVVLVIESIELQHDTLEDGPAKHIDCEEDSIDSYGV